MKIENISPEERDKMQVSVQIPVKTQKLIHSIKPHKGHVLFEINMTTGKYKEAEYESVDVKYENNGNSPHRKVIANKNCIYISALNRKNALKKFLQMMAQVQKTNP